MELLFRELLIGVTNFFRDPTAWDHLRTQAIPAMLKSRASSPVLRAWVPGCSSGEEAYTLAIILKEATEIFKPKRKFTIQIFATDLDRDSIDKARQGLYPTNIAADVSKERLKRFFAKEDLGYRVCKDTSSRSARFCGGFHLDQLAAVRVVNGAVDGDAEPFNELTSTRPWTFAKITKAFCG